MVIQNGCAFVEPARVQRVAKPEPRVVEVVAELVAEGAQERAKRSDLFADGGAHPHPDYFGSRVVVPEKFARPASFTDADWAGREHPKCWILHLAEIRGGSEELGTG